MDDRRSRDALRANLFQTCFRKKELVYPARFEPTDAKIAARAMNLDICRASSGRLLQSTAPIALLRPSVPMPRYLIRRGETYHVRKPVPLDLHGAFTGRKEITRSLRTKSLKAAVAASYAVLAGIEEEFNRARRQLHAKEEERQFLASDQVDEALRRFAGVTRGTVGAVTFARRPSSPEDAKLVDLAIRTGQAVPRPTSKAAVLTGLKATLDEVEYEAMQVGVTLPTDEAIPRPSPVSPLALPRRRRHSWRSKSRLIDAPWKRSGRSSLARATLREPATLPLWRSPR